MNRLELLESNDRWELKLSDAQVIRCIFDHAFSIEVQFGDQKLTLEVENEFTLLHENSHHQIDPERIESLGLGLLILRKEVTNFTIHKSGEIEMKSDSYKLLVEPHEDFEAWQLRSDNGLRIICMPSGELSIWRPE